MLRPVSNLKGCSIGATDGVIGEVEDLYFDDQRWTVRYLVIDTSGWLAGRRVLVSPWAIRAVDVANQSIAVDLTRAQVENSPSVETQQPIDRRYEMEYSRYYGYPYYWTGPYAWGLERYPLTAPVAPGEPPTERVEPEGDPHLRSTTAIAGYYIQAADGDIGHVEDFLVEDRSWTIRYAVVDTRNWWPGKKVLISPDWITHVDWYDSKVHVDLTRDTIKSSPEYDASLPLDREYEARLYESYRRPHYWDRSDAP
jgi:PRC-barrel domain